MKIRPLHDWAVIKRTGGGERTAGGIIIPSVAREKPAEGTVEAIGPGKYETGQGKGKREKFVPTTVKPGQRVAFIDFMAKDLEINGQEITLVREGDMLGTYEEGNYPLPREARPVSVKEEGPLLMREESGGKSAVRSLSAGTASVEKGGKRKRTTKKKSAKPLGREGAKAEKKKPKGSKAPTRKTEKKSVRKVVKKTAGKTAQKTTSQKRRKTTLAKPLSGKTGGEKKVQAKKPSARKKTAAAKRSRS